MASRRKGALTPEDRALWETVARKVSPLDAARDRIAARAAPGKPSKPAPEKAQGTPPDPSPKPAQTRSFRIGAASGPSKPHHDLAPSPAERLRAQAPGVDGHTMGRLRKGRWTPEARIDLHGMTLAQAHPALTRFIHDAHHRGRRLVLVITGKGGGDTPPFAGAERGVLRRQVPVWLQSAGLRPIVLQVLPAHRKHGGEGAYYVCLRRRG